LNALRRLAEQSYTRQQPQTKAQPVATKPPKVASADEALLKRAKSMPPRQFLTAAKQAKNDRMYPANNELRAVQSLSERNVFDAPTINILIDYILRTNDSINQALMDAIANSWLKANVTSPEAALQQIHTFEEQKATGKKRYQGQSKGVRQEKLPDWAKEGYQPKKKKVSEADRQTLAAQLEKLRQLGDKGGTN
jgi:replication initiation and membrane attachment protein